MIIRPSLLNFKSLDAFKSLMLDFNEINYVPPELQSTRLKLLKFPNDFEILTELREGVYKREKFYADFLIPQIDYLSDYAIDELGKKIESEFQYNLPERKLFVLDKINELGNIKIEIKSNLFYNTLPIGDIANQIDIVIEFLYNDLSLKNPIANDNKIRFNLSRSELTLLFILLKQKNLIDHKYNNEIGALIESNFMYLNEKEGLHKEITNVGKLIGDFINGTKTTKTASETLKNIFSKEDFFDVTI